MNRALLRDIVSQTLAGTLAFPAVVGMLQGDGVESYRVDLVRLETTFYYPSGETHVEEIDYPALEIGRVFSASAVVAAIRLSQAGKSKYREFLGRIMEAGTTNYVVYLSGKKAIYFGRRGDFHVEEFPDPAP